LKWIGALEVCGAGAVALKPSEAKARSAAAR